MLYIHEGETSVRRSIDLPISSTVSLQAIYRHISSLHLHRPGRFFNHEQINLALGDRQARNEQDILKLLKAARTEQGRPYLRAIVYTIPNHSVIPGASPVDSTNAVRLPQGTPTIMRETSTHSTAVSIHAATMSPYSAAAGSQSNGALSNRTQSSGAPQNGAPSSGAPQVRARLNRAQSNGSQTNGIRSRPAMQPSPLRNDIRQDE